jgi:hypothetical protein
MNDWRRSVRNIIVLLMATIVVVLVFGVALFGLWLLYFYKFVKPGLDAL